MQTLGKIKYPHPLQEIHLIELSSRCNLRCVYCTHPIMKRAKIDMSWETFERALEWARYFAQRGTQKELSLHGLGESTLHPDFIRMQERAREALPDCILQYSTNGVSFTEEHARAAKEFGVRVFVSLHRPEKAGLAVALCKQYGVLAQAHANFAYSAFNWAGQIDWQVTTQGKSVCLYLAMARGVVMSDGTLTACCMDTEKDGALGSIWDEIGSIGTKPYKLCESCEHQIVP